MLYANPFTSTQKSLSESELINWFLAYDISHFAKDFRGDGTGLAFSLFNQATQDIPAYRDFLRQNGWKNKLTVTSALEWSKIPPMDKKNYVGLHALNQMVPYGELGQYGKMISLSSGSSGQAFFWPRGTYQEIEGALLHERLLTSQFDIGRYRTLVVVAFSMGSYLAGTYTYNSIRWVASKGYNLTVVTPGMDVQDGLDMITKLAPLYEQVILAGYPPFIKDLLEEGISQGVNWGKWHTRLMMASEFFSEKWRAGVAQIAGIKDIEQGTTNIFGASEGTMFGWETPEAIFLRQAAAKNKDLQRALFGSELTPTLVEYSPLLRYFEVVGGSLHLTARAGIPLIRYDLKDRGGILTVQARRQILQQFGIELPASLQNNLSNFPMVYILGRADSATSIYGLLIYPEYIQEALENETSRLTGRFTLVSKSIRLQNPELIIHVELKQGKRRSDAYTQQLTRLITQTIMGRSREYSTLLSAVGDKAAPHVYLHPKNDPLYFPTRIKQKWIDR